jgi:transposase
MNTVIGIDVSKHSLDCYSSLTNEYKTFPNNEAGIENFIKIYNTLLPFKAIFESTGCYHRVLHRKLSEAGIEACIVNPYKSRCFAKSAGFLAKIDKVDAKMLCFYGQKMPLRAIAYLPVAYQELESLCRYRVKLEDDLHREKAQLELGHHSTYVNDEIAYQIKYFKTKIKEIEKRIDDLIQNTESFKEKQNILMTVLGIGARSIAALLCYLPELGSLNCKQIIALCGLAPYVCESGQMRGKAMIKGGRAHIRKALYMPILTSVRINPVISRFYQRLRSKGKPVKVALIACMRKLIKILNFLVKNKVTWNKITAPIS